MQEKKPYVEKEKRRKKKLKNGKTKIRGDKPLHHTSLRHFLFYFPEYARAGCSTCSTPICNPCPDLKSLLPRFVISAPI